MPLDAVRQKAVEKFLATDISSDYSEIRADLEVVEKELADELGSKHPMLSDKHTLQRFLVARKLKVPDTLSMIQQNDKWRAENLPVAVTDNLIAELKKGKLECHGIDVHGRPVIMVRSGLFDPKERDLQTAVNSVIYLIESTIAMHSSKTQFIIFYDRTDFSFRAPR